MDDTGNSSPICIADSPPQSQVKQTFTTASIELMLKRKDDKNEFTVMVNNLKKSSTAWSNFGFPARLDVGGIYQRIDGFTSCFQCKTTYTFQSDGTGSTKHLLRHICSKVQTSEGPLEKLFKLKKKAVVMLNSTDSTTMKDELTKWVCRSVRPFNIVADAGLKDVLQTVLDLGKKYQDLNSTDLLVTPTTIAKNVHQLAERYRSLLQPLLTEQAENNCLCLCPDLWNDEYRKVNYLGLTAVFTNKNYELISIDLCCCEYQEIDKSGDSVLRAIRRQLDLYGLTPFMDKKKIVFTSDRGPNILKALKGQPLILCFAHRMNNVLKICFYETAHKKRIMQAATTPTRQPKKPKFIIESSSDESLSEDDVKTPSPLKYIESNTSLSELPSKACELLDVITTSKQLVKYVKLCGLNKSIQDAGGVVLKQATVVRWLSLSNLLESVDLSYEHVRSILSKPSNTKQSFKLNKINIDGLKDLVRLLTVFKDVSILVQTGARSSLHMAYIALNKLEHHLNGNDVDVNGDFIPIDDRHEGD
ncbi:unnamed protein product [Rotaria magnacalcarata]|uniref:Hermes trasposase DNA-binding domain-containing protein n=1 Tax=Rotaria magnacalcarata TaxID=392030 RepID=A0A816L218_9BILA|nr:unnamed protein product [Rotaria magnacalcarata]CAF1590545.1 unnamed protein product [Rotaria magnacalcarata]CAF1929103.1 unnamed protein product [Rotaria magnacalcarata]CAF4006031.1 unnamed protein product [Rotaria magnacalcarata]CAF4020970.1 unnamed protein product [Rotaria magnacalcarata]